jgi:hypothetical protein
MGRAELGLPFASRDSAASGIAAVDPDRQHRASSLGKKIAARFERWCSGASRSSKLAALRRCRWIAKGARAKLLERGVLGFSH